MRTYLLAVDGIAPENVAQAVKMFIQGRVKRNNHTFLPSTAELAVEARKIADQRGFEEYQEKLAALPKPEEKPAPTPEERAKVAAMMDEMVAKLQGQHTQNNRRPSISKEQLAAELAELEREAKEGKSAIECTNLPHLIDALNRKTGGNANAA